jgi:hypothetical protein
MGKIRLDITMSLDGDRRIELRKTEVVETPGAAHLRCRVVE